MPLAAGHDARALVDRIAHVLLDLRDRGVVDERTDDDTRLHAVADLELGHALGELRRKGIVDAVLHEDPVRADAGLAGIAIL